jgi:NAD(P)-dependent dehydrogenase (short-subunit alcohol dehydrogenase family)|tara:strand:- start:367 stop:1101 length:735 start_codon:yes stop_codon:yes gene_type:complete
MNIKNKLILVVGGNGLIGNEIIKEIKSNDGIPINLDISSKNPICDFFKTDICSEKEISSSIKEILTKYKRIDGLVNAAYPRTNDWNTSFENVHTDSFSKNLNIQLSSIFSISKRVSKIMIKQRSGSIVNISSIYGSIGFDRSLYDSTKISLPVAYSAIKGGLNSLNRYFASFFGEYNIRCNCVSPGGIFDNQDGKFVNKYEKKVPLGRMGYSKDVSPIVVFLLSDKSSYITGQNIIVDGGLTII